jgi:hypothetical protein
MVKKEKEPDNNEKERGSDDDTEEALRGVENRRMILRAPAPDQSERSKKSTTSTTTDQLGGSKKPTTDKTTIAAARSNSPQDLPPAPVFKAPSGLGGNRKPLRSASAQRYVQALGGVYTETSVVKDQRLASVGNSRRSETPSNGGGTGESSSEAREARYGNGLRRANTEGSTTKRARSPQASPKHKRIRSADRPVAMENVDSLSQREAAFNEDEIIATLAQLTTEYENTRNTAKQALDEHKRKGTEIEDFKRYVEETQCEGSSAYDPTYRSRHNLQ